MSHTAVTSSATSKTRTQRLAYQISDFLMSNLAMAIYNIVRYYLLQDLITQQGFKSLCAFLSDNMVILGQVCFPVAMMGIYWLSGYYNNVYRKSLLQEATTTFASTFVCMIMVYFVALINDTVIDHFLNYEILLALWVILLACVYPLRLIITMHEKRLIAQSQIEFPALIIGCDSKAQKFATELGNLKDKLGYSVTGFVNINNDNNAPTQIGGLPVHNFNEIETVCKQRGITDLIVVPQGKDMDNILHTLNRLFPFNLPVKLLSDEKTDLFLSRGRLDTVYGTPLIDISSSNITECETNLKRTSDILFSIIALIVLLPFLAIIAAIIKIGSKGPVIFKQQRIGLHGKPFTIYKFRTMVVDAEADGQPKLTSLDDNRITCIGRILRKYRIDELPQFWNVLRGDMALVGPRPERQYFIDRIVKRAPQYTLLQQVRPGLTSFGMVKYGYASSIESMVERMRYDLIYIENISFATDLKIMIYTIWTVVTGKGL
ncbi:MAG TPA: sugar transferase [Candidatus Avimuribaculum pullicola]|nr:sugar transferase [Candidatus Avimuribaculum pullicola]